VGVAADLNDDSVLPLPAMTVYHPLRQIPFGGRLFVQAAGGESYALVPAITRAIHGSRPSSRWNAPRRSKTCAPPS
jgi:hypothetical protein